MFTDHKEHPVHALARPLQRKVAIHIAHKAQRWALRLDEFNFTVEHNPGALQ